MATSGTFNGRTTEESGWTGWIGFAGVMLGLFSAIEGLTAVYDDSYFLVRPLGLVVQADYQVWGWLHFGMGILAFVSHGRAQFQAGDVLQQIAGGGEPHAGQHGVHLPATAAPAPAGAAARHPQHPLDDHLVEYGHIPILEYGSGRRRRGTGGWWPPVPVMAGAQFSAGRRRSAYPRARSGGCGPVSWSVTLRATVLGTGPRHPGGAGARFSTAEQDRAISVRLNPCGKSSWVLGWSRVLVSIQAVRGYEPRLAAGPRALG